MLCGKKIFDKRAAEAAIAKAKTGRQYRQEKRAYYCTWCKAWHLTAREEVNIEKAVTADLAFREKWKAIIHPDIRNEKTI